MSNKVSELIIFDRNKSLWRCKENLEYDFPLCYDYYTKYCYDQFETTNTTEETTLTMIYNATEALINTSKHNIVNMSSSFMSAKAIICYGMLRAFIYKLFNGTLGQNIQALSLSIGLNWSEDVGHNWTSFIKNCKKLKHLNLTIDNMTEREINAIIKECPNLVSFYIRMVKLA